MLGRCPIPLPLPVTGKIAVLCFVWRQQQEEIDLELGVFSTTQKKNSKPTNLGDESAVTEWQH